MFAHSCSIFFQDKKKEKETEKRKLKKLKKKKRKKNVNRNTYINVIRLGHIHKKY